MGHDSARILTAQEREQPEDQRQDHADED
jgi:hypothetical protein